MTVVAQLRFDIPAMYSFHTKQSADIEVDLLYIEKDVPITKQLFKLESKDHRGHKENNKNNKRNVSKRNRY